jgi:trehalose-6-phosphatase
VQRRFHEELADLAGTYASTVDSKALPSIAAVQRELADMPAIFVGSGGALAVAAIAADEHAWRTGLLAVAATPLRLAGVLRNTDAAVVLFSARAKHSDVLAAARLARSAPLVVLVTGQPPEELDPRLRGLLDRVVELRPPVPDGFLATNSVLTFLTGWISASTPLPPELPALQEAPVQPPPGLFRRLFVAHGANGTGPALDLEARVNESGVSDVQLADYRNAAHGRHVGLAARRDDTLVVSLSDAEDTDLPARTLSLLPEAIQRVQLASPLSFPVAAIDQTVRVMRFFGELAAAHDLDPGRPKVSQFGRRMYHLSWRSSEATVSPPVRRKVRAAGAPARGPLVEEYSGALNQWKEQLRHAEFTGVVFDYDGTCCTAAGRFELPDAAVRNELLRLLESDARVAFASGRGRSLHTDLRRWVPQQYWPRVVVGMYNGAVMLTLDKNVPAQTDCAGALAAAADRVDELADQFHLIVERRTHQISVTLGADSPLAGAGLAAIVRSCTTRAPALPVVLGRSAHSVDITAANTSKVRVLNAVIAVTGGAVVAIGDQGQDGGNDFHFLAATPHSLTVDGCSPDPTRCWNLGADGEHGPSLLIRYLDALQPLRKAQLRWRWR